jgi:hypothetical protein
VMLLTDVIVHQVLSDHVLTMFSRRERSFKLLSLFYCFLFQIF